MSMLLPWGTEGKTIRRRAIWQLLALALMASGCATAAAQSPRGGGARYEKAATATNDSVTIENLLRWPMEGLAGINKVANGIRATFDPTDRTAGSLGFTDKQFQLEDGYVLTHRDVFFRESGAAVRIAIDPCFPPSRAAEIIGAEPGPVIYDPDGNDRGRIYRVIRDDVRMHVYSNPLTYRCVRSIEIYALPKLANTSIRRNNVTLENLLRWPLEGKTGLEKVEAGLHQVFEDMEPLPNQQFASVGAAYLADGTVLSFAHIGSHFDIGLKNDRCIQPEPYAELIGANGSVTPDAHGVDRGKSYRVKRNGVIVIIDTTPNTYQCITHVSILKDMRGAK